MFSLFIFRDTTTRRNSHLCVLSHFALIFGPLIPLCNKHSVAHYHHITIASEPRLFSTPYWRPYICLQAPPYNSQTSFLHTHSLHYYRKPSIPKVSKRSYCRRIQLLLYLFIPSVKGRCTPSVENAFICLKRIGSG